MSSSTLKCFLTIIALPKMPVYALCPSKKKNISWWWAEKITQLLWRASCKYPSRHYPDKQKHPMVTLWTAQNQPKLKSRHIITWTSQSSRFPSDASTCSTWRYWLVEQSARRLHTSPKEQSVQQFGQICGIAAVTWTFLHSTPDVP